MVITMKVNTLFKKVGLESVSYNHDVYKITTDSRLCTENAIFVVINGNHEDGHKYINSAIDNGAKTIITTSCERKYPYINYVFVDNVRKILACLAKEYYANVSKKLKLVGVVGTNGKTTTSTIAYNFFNYLNKSAMLIGSNGVFFNNYEATLNNTTPDILTIYQFLTLAKKKKIKYVFMEISSIAVDQYRVYGLDFDCLIFTNFSQDHLDYHKTLDRYLYCKIIPFIKLKKEAYAIINADDEASTKIMKYADCNFITYGYSRGSNLLGTINYVNAEGISFYAKDVLFKSHLLGEFNSYNILAVLALCDVFNIPYDSYASFLNVFDNVKGRMNKISFKNRNIIIDYAHTFMATKKVIEEAYRLCKHKLHIVIGCGGNREKEKRGMIGKLLDELDAEVILTSDNPRFENPQAIIADIRAEMAKEVTIIEDRKEAINYALGHLEADDYLLVLGKGCEKYMDINGIKYPYSDLEVINDWISAN